MTADPVPRPEWAKFPDAPPLVDRAPKRGAGAFECPHCGAFAQQTWTTHRFSPPNSDLSLPLRDNPASAFCGVCEGQSIWLEDKMIWPFRAVGPVAVEGMPDDVRACYDEARRVYPISPKSAGALLRLALEKLIVPAGSKQRIDDAIGRLVAAKAIEEHVQQMMDALRIVGNSAVHPGFIDLDEAPETASFLFELLNMIVVETITKKQRVGKLYATLPPDKLKGVEDRAKRIK
jgi:hypothetical protein